MAPSGYCLTYRWYWFCHGCYIATFCPLKSFPCSSTVTSLHERHFRSRPLVILISLSVIPLGYLFFNLVYYLRKIQDGLQPKDPLCSTFEEHFSSLSTATLGTDSSILIDGGLGVKVGTVANSILVGEVQLEIQLRSSKRSSAGQALTSRTILYTPLAGPTQFETPEVSVVHRKLQNLHRTTSPISLEQLVDLQ